MTQSDFLKKLLAEIPSLQENNTLDDVSAGKLRDHCHERLAIAQTHVHELLQLFMVLLSVFLIGTGMIMLVAHNWDKLPPWERMAMTFIPLLVAMFAGIETLRRDRGRVWEEASAQAICWLTMTCLAVVSQQYHLYGTFPDFIRINLWLMLPLLYVFRSDTLCGIYSLCTFFLLKSPNGGPFSPPLLPLLAFPYLIWRYRQVTDGAHARYLELLMLANIASPLLSLLLQREFAKSSLALLLATITSLVYAIGSQNFPPHPRNLFRHVGCLGRILLAMFLISPSFWTHHPHGAAPWYELPSLLLPAFGLAIWLLIQRTDIARLDVAGLALIAVCPHLPPPLACILANLLLAFAGGLFFWRGVTRHLRAPLNWGLGIFLMIACCHLLDYHKNILLYACLFILSGILFALFNAWIGKKWMSPGKPAPVAKNDQKVTP